MPPPGTGAGVCSPETRTGNKLKTGQEPLLMAKPGLADIVSVPGRHLTKDLTNLRNILCKENFQDPMTVLQCNKI